MSVRSLIPATTGLVVFFLVFNLFYTITPYPFAIATVEDVYHFQPKAYTHPADKPEKLIAKSTTWKGYKVIEYWYYWPYDGNVKKDDWEPVILLIDDNHVKAVAHRIHYNWRVAYEFPVDGDRPVVSFAVLWHTPMLKEPLQDWAEVNLRPVIGNPPEEVNYNTIFGFSYIPTQSAIAAAIVYGVVAGVASFFISREIIS